MFKLYYFDTEALKNVTKMSQSQILYFENMVKYVVRAKIMLIGAFVNLGLAIHILSATI